MNSDIINCVIHLLNFSVEVGVRKSHPRQSTMTFFIEIECAKITNGLYLREYHSLLFFVILEYLCYLAFMTCLNIAETEHAWKCRLALIQFLYHKQFEFINNIYIYVIYIWKIKKHDINNMIAFWYVPRAWVYIDPDHISQISLPEVLLCWQKYHP